MSDLAGKPQGNVLTLCEVGAKDNLGLGIDNVQVVVLNREEEKQEEEVENELPGVVTVPEGEGFLTEEENTLNTEIETDLFTT